MTSVNLRNPDDPEHALYTAPDDAMPEDYTLKPGKHCWLTVDKYSIRIADKATEVSIKVYLKGEEGEGPIGVTALPKHYCPCGQAYEDPQQATECEKIEKMRDEEAASES